MCIDWNCFSGDMAHGPFVNVPEQKIILKVITHISLNKFFIIHKIYVVYQKTLRRTLSGYNGSMCTSIATHFIHQYAIYRASSDF